MNNEPAIEKLHKESERWKHLNWVILILIGLVGFIVIGFMSIGFYMGSHLYKVNVPLTDATMEIRIDAVLAYLWFEEMLGGDEDKNMDDILKSLDQADWYAKAMIKGGENSHLKLLPLKETEFQDSIKQLQSLLKEHRALFNARLEEKDSSGPGSQIDHVHHSLIEKFIRQADNLESDLKRHMVDEYQLYKYIWLSATTFLGLLFFASGYAYYRYDTYRKNNYLKILELRQMVLQSEKMAALGKMILSISHEINNPNNFVSFNIPILKEYIQDLIPIIDGHAERNPDFNPSNMSYKEFREDLNKLLTNIENGSKRISNIVYELKEFSKRKDITKMDWVDIKEVIDGVVTITGTKIRSIVDSFEINIAEKLPQFYSDSQIIELILINLLNNAADAADKENSWVKLDVLLKKINHNTLIIEVSDNGCGINESDVNKIFDPFFSSKSSKEGTGMGLYLCRSLTDQIGAHLEVDSEFGKGSTFRLILNRNGISDLIKINSPPC